MTPHPPAELRRARRDDLDALVALENATFAYDRMSARQYRRHLASASAQVLVAMQGRRLAGAVVVFFRRGTGVARLYSLATAAAARGRGIGAALLRMAEDAARRRGCSGMRLEVRLGNRAAIALYEQSGYAQIGRRRGYYDDGADALRYEKRWAGRA